MRTDAHGPAATPEDRIARSDRAGVAGAEELRQRQRGKRGGAERGRGDFAWSLGIVTAATPMRAALRKESVIVIEWTSCSSGGRPINRRGRIRVSDRH